MSFDGIYLIYTHPCNKISTIKAQRLWEMTSPATLELNVGGIYPPKDDIEENRDTGTIVLRNFQKWNSVYACSPPHVGAQDILHSESLPFLHTLTLAY
jgi:hypothetical protein